MSWSFLCCMSRICTVFCIWEQTGGQKFGQKCIRETTFSQLKHLQLSIQTLHSKSSHTNMILYEWVVLLTSSSGLVSWRRTAGLTLAHWVDGDDPELVVHEGGKLQDDRVKVPWVSWQVPPPAWLPAVLLKLDQELCRDTCVLTKSRLCTAETVEIWGYLKVFDVVLLILW